MDPEGEVVCRLDHPERERPRIERSPEGLILITPVPPLERVWLWQQLLSLSNGIAVQAQNWGGALLHGGLAQLPAQLQTHPDQAEGVLLGGRSGVGKSTACARLPLPWRSLSDDLALVVRGGDGRYWAHPWPTWSRFFDPASPHYFENQPEQANGPRWDVQRPVLLRGIFILEQGVVECIHPLSLFQATASLCELARHPLPRWQDDSERELRARRTQRFNNLYDLAHQLPVSQLDVRLDGAFWEQIGGIIPVSPSHNLAAKFPLHLERLL
jgi:SynChlorMet cassette protein ScmC